MICWYCLTHIQVRKKANIRNQYNQAPHLTHDTTWESNKNTIKHHTQESQEVSPFPAGDRKATTNRQKIRQTQNTNNRNDRTIFHNISKNIVFQRRQKP